MGAVKVIDAMCGKGKTSWAIQYINEIWNGKQLKSGFGEKKSIIYVTPYLDEVGRIIQSCPNADFKQPNNKNEDGSKLKSLKCLIDKGENIATTHTLFKMMDNEMLELLEHSGYILILDEVLNVLNEVPLKRADVKVMLNSGLCEIKDNSLVWLDDEYDGDKYSEIRKMADIGNIYYYRDSFMFWTITPKSFKVFDEVYILTYLFDGQTQRYFYDMHNLGYVKNSVVKNGDRYELVGYDATLDNRDEITPLLNIYEDGKSKYNSNYAKKVTNTQFSSSWLKRADKETVKVLKNNITNYMRSCDAKVDDVFWTTLKEFAPKVSTRGKNTYNKNENHNFISHNIRATNEYKDRTTCVYLYNRFMHPIEKSFFEDNGVNVDEETLAVSDLIQWIFRGCIRNGEPMNVYIPSDRMRNLLYDYLEYKI